MTKRTIVLLALCLIVLCGGDALAVLFQPASFADRVLESDRIVIARAVRVSFLRTEPFQGVKIFDVEFAIEGAVKGEKAEHEVNLSLSARKMDVGQRVLLFLTSENRLLDEWSVGPVILIGDKVDIKGGSKDESAGNSVFRSVLLCLADSLVDYNTNVRSSCLRNLKGIGDLLYVRHPKYGRAGELRTRLGESGLGLEGFVETLILPSVKKLIPSKGAGSAIRDDAILAAGRLQDVEMIPGIVKIIKSKGGEYKGATDYVLGNFRKPEATKRLIPLLKDELALIRWSSARSLSVIGDLAAVPFVMECMNDASESRIRRFYEDNRATIFTTRQKIWVKSLVTPDRESAEEACRRARAGEDFDELIAEYFVPYFANKPKGKSIGKFLENNVMERKGYWCDKSEAGPLDGMNAGDISEPVLRYGKGPDWAVLKIESVTEGYVEKLEDVRDTIYQVLWLNAADKTVLLEVDMSQRHWCAKESELRAQLWAVAQKYDKQGQVGKAVSACLLALNEDWPYVRFTTKKIKPGQFYPEEQYLVDHGLDIFRYYAGGLKFYPGLSAPIKQYGRLVEIEKDRGISLLLKVAEKRVGESADAAYTLSGYKVSQSVPILRELLKDRHVHINESHSNGEVSFYASYYVRERAKKALDSLGEDTSGTKLTIGEVVTHGRK